jgi:hypothetical protein
MQTNANGFAMTRDVEVDEFVRGHDDAAAK